MIGPSQIPNRLSGIHMRLPLRIAVCHDSLAVRFSVAAEKCVTVNSSQRCLGEVQSLPVLPSRP